MARAEHREARRDVVAVVHISDRVVMRGEEVLKKRAVLSALLGSPTAARHSSEVVFGQVQVAFRRSLGSTFREVHARPAMGFQHATAGVRNSARLRIPVQCSGDGVSRAGRSVPLLPLASTDTVVVPGHRDAGHARGCLCGITKCRTIPMRVTHDLLCIPNIWYCQVSQPQADEFRDKVTR